MDAKLFKQKHETKEGRTFYSFYLLFANGEKLKIQPNSWVDDNEKKHSNYDKLAFIATDDSLPF